MPGLAAPAPAPASNAAAPEATPAAVDVSKLEGEAETRYFAEAMRAEHEGATMAAGGPVESEAESKAQADAAKAKPKDKRAATKEFDSAKIAELLKAGDLEGVAKEAGIDLRVTSKDWSAFRNEEAKSKHKLKERETAIAKRESELAGLVNNTKQSAAHIIKAAEYARERDWIGLLETASGGEKIETILKEITDNALDPSTRKMRKLEMEREQEKREADELRRKVAEREAKEANDRALSGYRANLRRRLESNEALGKHKDDESFDVLVNEILNWQIANASRYDHLDQPEAERQADADAIEQFKRTIKAQSERWLKYLDNASTSTGNSDVQSGDSSATKQGEHGTRKSVVRSISKAQGTGSTQSRPLTEAEEIAETARLLRQERLAARR